MNAAIPNPLREEISIADSALARDILAGLSSFPKTIPCTWLYDREGSELFEDITRTKAYYPTRAETALLKAHMSELAALAGEGVSVVEIGAGSVTKTRLLLSALKAPKAYLPIDISADFMLESLASLRTDFPGLPCIPVIADFTDSEALLNAIALCPTESRRLAFFPGSTIGNLTPQVALDFLNDLGRALGPGSLLAIGADATSDAMTLARAYDDPEGITAAFNLNLLARINRELNGDFQLESFTHEARVNQELQRVEMHLVSQAKQDVRVLGRTFAFEEGESIHTENSHKFGKIRFESLAASAGWQSTMIWRGDDHAFEFHVLERP
jgi:L-histidine N-alpha-methyltransferase